MANKELILPSIGNGVQSTNAPLKSLKKFLRVGNRKVRVFIVTSGGAAINETIATGERIESVHFASLAAGATQSLLNAIGVTISGGSVSLAEAVNDWTGLSFAVIVKVAGK